MTDIYVMLIEDRHTDPDVIGTQILELFTDKDEALARMRQLAEEYNNHPQDLDEIELSEGSQRLGFIGYTRYSYEGDSISVLRRTLQGA